MKNIGVSDAVFRYAIGVLLLLALFHPEMEWRFESLGNWKLVLIALAAFIIATSVSHICPAYWIFGFKTCNEKDC